MYRTFDVRIIVQAGEVDDCEDSDSITEQLADLIEVRKLELGECKPRFVGVRVTDTNRKPEEIRGKPAPRAEEKPHA